jgi:Mor family transcriptional regulator
MNPPIKKRSRLKPGPVSRFDAATLNKMQYLHHVKGYTVQELAAHYRCTRQYIHRLVWRGVPQKQDDS